ncbi:MAG: glycerol-3-phosphate 1-O-acyltransferase PlsY [Oscillospiraceae bacterium]|nr:glycerol-3-phosphate 1-O-acyltransferase PlsY [Oscillospiraceae bacterium]
MIYLKLAGIFLIGYLLGSISFAIVISKVFYKQDIRNFGSGNAGMTNVLRTFGIKAAAATFAGDFLKGTVSVLIAKAIMNTVNTAPAPGVDFYKDLAVYIVVSGALLGHLKPVFFGFKGGKGISVAFGSMMAATPPITLAAFAVWGVTVALTKYVSLASILAVAGYTVFTFISFYISGTYSIPHGVSAIVLPAVIIYAHRSNIKRLMAGTERKIGEKAK